MLTNGNPTSMNKKTGYKQTSWTNIIWEIISWIWVYFSHLFHCILEMSLLIIKLQISTLTHTLIKLYVLYIQKSRLVLSIAIDYFKSADRANFLHEGPAFLTSSPHGPCISSIVRLLWTCYYLKSRRFELVKMLKAVGLASTRFHIKFIPSE